VLGTASALGGERKADPVKTICAAATTPIAVAIRSNAAGKVGGYLVTQTGFTSSAEAMASTTHLYDAKGKPLARSDGGEEWTETADFATAYTDLLTNYPREKMVNCGPAKPAGNPAK
jgi:hypothetical protein